MVTRLTPLAALVAALLALTGCGGNPHAAAPPRPTLTISSPPPPPPTRESPQHFIRRWAAEDVRIQHTGDTSTFRAMSRGCRGCEKLARLVERIYRNGGFIHTKGWRIRKISPSGPHAFDLFVVTWPTTYAVSASAPPRHLPAGRAEFRLDLRPRARSWNVTFFAQVAR